MEAFGIEAADTFLDTTSGLLVTAAAVVDRSSGIGDDVVDFTPVDGGIGDVVEFIPVDGVEDVDTGGGGIDDVSIVDGSPLYCGCEIGNVDMYGGDTQYVKLVVGGIEDGFTSPLYCGIDVMGRVD